MRRKIVALLFGLILSVAAFVPANAQLTATVVTTCGTPPLSNTAGRVGLLTMDTNGLLCSGAVVTPGGTQAINLTQVLGAAHSATNPIFVSPATAATPWAVSGTITANGGTRSIGITPTDRTIASTSGASQTLMAANATRRQVLIQNTGNANCGVNPTGGTAVIGGAGTLTLVPNGSYQPIIPTLAAITVICTAAQPIYAEES